MRGAEAARRLKFHWCPPVASDTPSEAPLDDSIPEKKILLDENPDQADAMESIARFSFTSECNELIVVTCWSSYLRQCLVPEYGGTELFRS